MSRLIDADALIEFCAERWIPLNIDAVNMQPTIQPVETDTNVGDKISKFIDGLEEIFADLRERHVDDSVCGLCEYDGAYMGQSGDWCNECPGFDRDDCFKLSDETRKKWTEEIINALPTIQPEKAQLSKECTTSDLISRMETVERLRGVVDVTVPITDYDGGYIDGIETGISIVSTMPTIQPEPHEGHWIGSDGSYICSECNGDPLDFIDTMGASCDAYVETLMKFCPNCGAKMSNQNKIKGERQK